MSDVRAFMQHWAGVIGGGIAVILLALLVFHIHGGSKSKSATAYFTRTVHLYAGSDVVVLGVKVGSVTSVEPEGNKVRVDFTYKDSLKLPSNVHAVIVEPTIVADRTLQLDPPYAHGPALADGATIPLRHTGIPIELDAFNRNVARLAKSLGPQGANSTGSLSRLVRVAASNLRGNGARTNRTITGVARMLGTLGDGRADLFATVRNLQRLVHTLGRHDSETTAFSHDLAEVARFLDAQRHDFGTALRELGNTLDDVAGFVRDNRAALARNVSSLTSVTQVLDRERMVLAHTLDAGAVGITNYPHMYSSAARTYNSRFVGNSITDSPALFICQLFASVGGPPKTCMKYLHMLDNVPLPTNGRDPTLGGILPGTAPR